MPLTTQQQKAVWKAIADKIGETTAVRFSKAELIAAANAADSWASDNAASFNAALPNPFRSTATAAEKNLLLAYVCLARAGLL